MVGVVTKNDVVARICECQGDVCTIAAGLMMSVDILEYVARDLLQDVWLKMLAWDLKNVPIVGADGRSLGVLNARDALGGLLQDVKDEEPSLHDYVMDVG